MKRILALFALALAASPLMAAPTNPGYICSGPHKYSVTLADPSDPNSAWSFPCLLPEYYSDQSLARYISQEKCLTELMLNWSENFLHFVKSSSANANTQAKIVAQYEAAVADVNAGRYASAYRNIVRASNKVSDLIKNRKVVCAEGEDILLASFDAVNGLWLIIYYPPPHPES